LWSTRYCTPGAIRRYIASEPVSYFRRARQNELTLRYRNTSISKVPTRNFS
jgi:hypothetical protein